MIKRLLAYTILVSMTLHCACRLGLLDQVYQKRQAIAFAIGLIAEIPIAVCKGDYDFDRGLRIEPADVSHAIPQAILQVREINLFFISQYHLPISRKILLIKESLVIYSDLYSLTLEKSIFHPPSILV